MDLAIAFGVCVLVAALISGGIMMFVRSKLKTVRFERTACNYTRSGSFKTTEKADRFLFSTVTKVPIPKNDNK